MFFAGVSIRQAEKRVPNILEPAVKALGGSVASVRACVCAHTAMFAATSAYCARCTADARLASSSACRWAAEHPLCAWLTTLQLLSPPAHHSQARPELSQRRVLQDIDALGFTNVIVVYWD